MRVRIDLEPGETIEQAEEKLAKAILTKQEIREELSERYDDPILNEFHDDLTKGHLELIEKVKTLVAQELHYAVGRKF